MVTLSSILQSPVQALLRPAMWVPGIKSLHSYHETWQCLSTPEVVMRSILKSLKHLADTDDVGATYDIHKISEDNRFIRIFTFTWAEWLDVIEISIGPDSVQAKSFSTGLFPLCIPFACILNLISEDNRFIRIFTFTWAEWLDVIEISIGPDSVQAKSFSTGLFPLCIPFACILNLAFFWCPFYDNKFNQIRLQKLREGLDIDLAY